MTHNQTRYTILVVDDEADIRLMMEDILGVHYRVLSAVDGQDALAQIEAGADQIDLVMTDLRMPRLDGMELVERLRREYPRLGIIMISAHGTLNEAVDALKRGVFDYITKPLPADLDEIYAKCERFFKVRALELEQERLQRQLLELSYFPRSNPHFVARLSLLDKDALLLPGNNKTRDLLHEAAGGPPDEENRFRYSQGAVAELFPGDFLDTLRRIAGTQEVIEVDGVVANKKYYHHTYTPFVDDPNKIFINITDTTKRKRAEQVLADEVQAKYNFEEIIGQSEVLQEVLRHVELVAPMDTSVLILGETGTGKELICRAIHHLSQRQDRPLVKLNCAAIPSGLIESELFGHEKGSFTGAIAQKQGRFELAHEGTIFLDEIGDIPLETQPKLLRLLQEQEFERVGSTSTIKVDVRVIAATHRNLEQMVKNGQFREDLFYRLNVFPVNMPPLRQRRADIPALANYFAYRIGTRCGRPASQFSPMALERLLGYPWPGNVRELENIIERAVILARGGVIEPEHIQVEAAHSPATAAIKPLEQIEREHIIAALKNTQGKISGKGGAAELLDLKPTTLESRMKKLGIDQSAL